MEKIPAHKSKYYSKLSSTVISGGRETSRSTFPFLRPVPNFLPVRESSEPEEVAQVQRGSIVARLCASLRQFRQRCPLATGLPCIDRILSPSRRRGPGESPGSKILRYRRPKSQRQLELAQLPKISQVVTTTSHAQKPSYQRPLSILQNDENVRERRARVEPSLELRRDEFSTVHGRTRPRKMYTPDGKVIHYVIPCHSDSSFTDHHPNNAHKMTQVNSESLVDIQVVTESSNQNEQVNIIQSECDLELAKLEEEITNLQLPSEEVRRPPTSPQMKRVTFSENLVEEFNGKLNKATATTAIAPVTSDGEKTTISKIPKLKSAVDSTLTDVNFDGHFSTPTTSPPSIRRQLPGSKIPGLKSELVETKSGVEPSCPMSPRVIPTPCQPKSRPENPNPSKSRSTSRVRKPQFENPSFLRPPNPYLPLKTYNRVTESWFPGAVDRESWDRQKPLRTLVESLSKKEVQKELHLKYGRFPKVLQMKKKLKCGEDVPIRPVTATSILTPPPSPRIPRALSPRLISASVSSSSLTMALFQEEVPPRVNPSTRSSYPTVIGSEIKSKRLRVWTEESRIPRVGEALKKGILARNLSRSPLLTKRMRSAIGGDVDQLLLGNFLDVAGNGNDEVKKGRPSTTM